MPTSLRLVLAAAAAAALAIAHAPVALGEQPLPDTSGAATWTTNGSVNAIATIGDTTYVGGKFSYVGPATGAGFLLDPATGATDAAPQIVGAVDNSTLDGAAACTSRSPWNV